MARIRSPYGRGVLEARSLHRPQLQQPGHCPPLVPTWRLYRPLDVLAGLVRTVHRDATGNLTELVAVGGSRVSSSQVYGSLGTR